MRPTIPEARGRIRQISIPAYRADDDHRVRRPGRPLDQYSQPKGPSRAQIATFGDNYLLSGDPSQPNYYGYNFYHVQTDFNYIGLVSNLGHGWKLENKVYTYRYWNKQNYNNPTVQANGFFAPAAASITATSGVDKLNGYRRVGDITSLNYETARG